MPLEPNFVALFPPGDHPVPEHTQGHIFANEDKLIAALEADDPGTPSAAKQPKYLYRGQTGRYPRPWPPRDIADLNIVQHSYTFDSIIPTDYRHLEDHLTLNQHSSLDVQTAYGNEVAHLRALITYLAIDRWISAYPNVTHQVLPQEVTSWFQSLAPSSGSMPFDRLGNIGQHCELPSGYTDATSSKYAALWFASHNWVSGSYSPNATGIVYRIKYDVLCQAEADLNLGFGLTGDGCYRHVDIRQTPWAVCPRPSLQNGWSLINFESPRLLLELIDRQAIQAFQFRRSDNPPSVNTLSKNANIAPEPDGVKEAIAWIHDNPTNANLQHIINAHSSNPNGCHQLLSQPSTVDIIFHGLQSVV